MVISGAGARSAAVGEHRLVCAVSAHDWERVHGAAGKQGSSSTARKGPVELGLAVFAMLEESQ